VVDLVPLCQEHRIAVAAEDPFSHGRLFGEGSGRHAEPGEALRGGRRDRGRIDAEAGARLAEVARGQGMSLAQLAIRWTLQQPGVTAVVVPAVRPSQTRDFVLASEKLLQENEIGLIDGILRDRDRLMER
jgi:aryl-alcohol dehydrogenase-like predicted oxidoreductase